MKSKQRRVFLIILFVTLALLTSKLWTPLLAQLQISWVTKAVELIDDRSGFLQGLGVICTGGYFAWTRLSAKIRRDAEKQRELLPLEPVTVEQLRGDLVRGGKIDWVDRNDTDVYWLRRKKRVAITGQRKLGKTREAIELIGSMIADRKVGLFTPSIDFNRLAVGNLDKMVRPQLHGYTQAILYLDDLPFHFQGRSLSRLTDLLQAMEKACPTIYLVATARYDQTSDEHKKWWRQNRVDCRPLSPLDDDETARFVTNALQKYGMTADEATLQAFVESNDGTPERPLNVLRQFAQEKVTRLEPEQVRQRMAKEISVTWAENRAYIAQHNRLAGRLIQSLAAFHAAGVRPYSWLVTVYAQHLAHRSALSSAFARVWAFLKEEYDIGILATEHTLYHLARRPESSTIAHAWAFLKEGYDIGVREWMVHYPDVALEGVQDSEVARTQMLAWLGQSSRGVRRLLQKPYLSEKQLAGAFFDIAYKARQTSRNDDAIAAFQKAIQLDPDSAYPHDNLGDVYADIGRNDDAIAAFQKAIQLDPDLAYPHNGLGNVYRSIGRNDDAIAAYQTAIQLDPDDAYPHSGLGLVYYEIGRNDDAIAAFQKAIQLDPDLAYPHNGLGNVYRSIGRNDDAIAAFQQAIALDPDAAIPHSNLGNVYQSIGRNDEAIAAFQQAIALDPDAAYPHNGLGNVYSDIGRTEEAIAAFQQAIALDPDAAYPHNGLGNVYSDIGRNDDAIAAYQTAIALDPDSAYPHDNLGDVYADIGRNDDAIAAFQKAIQLDPDLAYPHNGLGNVYQSIGRNDEAIASYKKAIALDPDAAYPHHNLGLVYRTIDQTDEAIAAFQTAIQLDPDYASVYSSLAACYKRLGQLDKMEQQIAIARPLIANENEYNRARFAAICGQVEEALALLEVALDKKQASLEWISRDPDFIDIRQHPRFQALVKSGTG